MSPCFNQKQCSLCQKPFGFMIGKLSFFFPLSSSSRWSPSRLGENTLLALHTQLAIRIGHVHAFRYLSIFYVLSTVLDSITINKTTSLPSKSFYSNARRQSKQMYNKSGIGQQWEVFYLSVSHSLCLCPAIYRTLNEPFFLVWVFP